MWKEMQEDAQFENSQMIGCQVDCNKCRMKCTISRLENDGIASRLQSMWKEMQEDAQFENSQMIGCQVDCNKCGMNYRTTHNF